MKGISILLALALSGCTSLNRPALTEFQQLPNGFVYAAKAGYEVDWSYSEAKRIEYLDRHVAESGICPRGYTLKDRIVSMPGTLSTTIYYFGTCSA
jgi:hypothetical protein